MIEQLGKFCSLFLDQPVILIVRPDPKPLHLLAAQESQCAVVTAHSCRPEISHSLEMKRRMARVLPPEFKNSFVPADEFPAATPENAYENLGSSRTSSRGTFG